MSISKEKLSPVSKRLLAGLPRDEYERLSSHLDLVRISKNRVLYEAGDSMRYAYFLTSGMVFMLAITEGGQTIDVGLVDNAGFVGVPIILLNGQTPRRVVTQLPCEALRIKSGPLLAEFNRGGELQRLLLRYTHALQTQLIQSAICHSLRTHQAETCRWLLVTGDCVRSETFDTIQEHIANMLGHQRNRITLAARELLKDG